ncbi:MAG TPA: hypothetical protein VFT22_07425 [Kofleriaceae bacterium]|nr:hypothetical protein [Kofleriaceae bacterium]
MSDRKTRLIDCDPRWVTDSDGREGSGVRFDCPEGHEWCIHVVPVTPALDGAPHASWQSNGAVWQRTGDSFETLTLTPSIRTTQRYPSKEAALADGVLEEYFDERLLCALHIFIRNGQIEFCGDSR